MESTSKSAPTSPWRTVALAGLLAGALDITFAFIFYGYRGAGPARILRSIASALLGPAAFSAGAWAVVLGGLLHFLIALGAAFIFYTTSRRLPWLTRRPLRAGALYGVVVYIAMHAIVLPLSRIGWHTPMLLDLVGELFSHIFLFGMVIALGAARASKTAAARI